MKKLTSLLVLLIIPLAVIGQSLNSNAEFIREEFSNEYTSTIRAHAVDEWDRNYEMIIYTINNQVDALFSIIKKFETENTQILYDAMIEWSHDGAERSNIQRWNDMEVLSLENLIAFHCDWEMVEYTYDRQVKAKNSF